MRTAKIGTSAIPATSGNRFAQATWQVVVLGAFAFLTVPLAIGLLAGDGSVERWLPVYVVGLGLTHFLMTGFVYLDASNLRYFNSSLRTRLIYFGAPVAIFAVFDLVAATGVRSRLPQLDAALFHLVFAANFLHVSRQSFRILQQFKSAASGLPPEGLRSCENMFFLGLALLQAETLWSGMHFDPTNLGVRITTGLVAGLFVLALAMHAAVVWRGRRQRSDWVPLLYFAFQTFAGALAVWDTSLYPVALAMHYVEYHLVMAPRVFAAPAQPERRSDRIRRWISRSKIAFYGGVLAVASAIWFAQRSQLYLDPEVVGLPLRIALHAFDGLFLAHFFVDAFVWDRSVPHYHRTLAPLYASAETSRLR